MHVSAMKGIKYYFNLLTSVYQNKRKENIKEIKWTHLYLNNQKLQRVTIHNLSNHNKRTQIPTQPRTLKR
jgi:hypothetical protein